MNLKTDDDTQNVSQRTRSHRTAQQRFHGRQTPADTEIKRKKNRLDEKKRRQLHRDFPKAPVPVPNVRSSTYHSRKLPGDDDYIGDDASDGSDHSSATEDNDSHASDDDDATHGGPAPFVLSQNQLRLTKELQRKITVADSDDDDSFLQKLTIFQTEILPRANTRQLRLARELLLGSFDYQNQRRYATQQFKIDQVLLSQNTASYSAPKVMEMQRRVAFCTLYCSAMENRQQPIHNSYDGFAELLDHMTRKHITETRKAEHYWPSWYKNRRTVKEPDFKAPTLPENDPLIHTALESDYHDPIFPDIIQSMASNRRVARAREREQKELRWATCACCGDELPLCYLRDLKTVKTQRRFRYIRQRFGYYIASIVATIDHRPWPGPRTRPEDIIHWNSLVAEFLDDSSFLRLRRPEAPPCYNKDDLRNDQARKIHEARKCSCYVGMTNNGLLLHAKHICRTCIKACPRRPNWTLSSHVLPSSGPSSRR